MILAKMLVLSTNFASVSVRRGTGRPGQLESSVHPEDHQAPRRVRVLRL